MKIAVLGAGAMGSVYGARLAEGGAEVTLLDVNQPHLDAIARDGLEVTLDEGTRHHRLHALRPEDFRGPVDVVLVFTKIFHTAAALGAIADQLGGATLLSLQNGIGNAERLATHIPSDRILVGMTMTPAEFLGPGRVASHGPAKTAFYAADGQDRPILQTLCEAMRAGGIDAAADPAIEVAIWEKASFNCTMNALCALSEATPGAIGVSEAGRGLAGKVAAEAVAVANAVGVSANLQRVEALIEHACAHHLHHEPSMLQDRKAGRPTEVDALNGAVARLGEANGVPTPVNRTLADLIGLMEDAVRFRAG